MDGITRHWMEQDAAEYFGLKLWCNLITDDDRRFLRSMGIVAGL